ncbi:alpha/beta-hydrolase [Penicillium riverlandense]|uniref:alpha/beta-hydrolase n=1 Tax=Penicillium riverlandense TaxID=1903569 RepID=UPI002547E084|nr:alpha/beta-hydrolase [Penicillium riverlandense]KAJ5819102.1 alpha/beta-hydrolase [Penicillium riverlandense]
MLEDEKPTIVLIPGAWHLGSTYEPVAELLRKQGYPAHTMTLLSAGGPTSTTAVDDAEHIQSTLLNDLIAQGKEVVLVLHSYSGVPGSICTRGLTRKDQITEGKKGGVVALVYVTAFMLREGQSLDSFLGGMEKRNTIVFEEDKAIMTDPAARFYNDLDEETIAKCLALLQYQAKPTMYSPLTYEAYRDVPATYLLCENDRAIPLVKQQEMVDKAGEGIKIRICKAGHSPMLSMPQLVTDVIHKAASAARATRSVLP